MNILNLFLIFSLIAIVYVYIGYPIIVILWGWLRDCKVKKDKSFMPYVSILIAAYNEESAIEDTVLNKLALDYPEDRLEVIVVSDCSSDHTEDIVNSIEDPRVKLLIQNERRGKTSALNRAFDIAIGEILVFADANSIYEKSALKELVANFSDESVGYVTGHMVYVGSDGSTVGDGCSQYMKYENFLRRYETLIGSVVGVDGGIDAIRSHLYKKMRDDQLPDFVLPLHVITTGKRVVYESAAVLKEAVLRDDDDEAKMRYRVALRALWAIHDNRKLLLNIRDPIYSFQLWSHKVLRYMVPVLMILVLFLNIFLVSNGAIYIILLVGQVMFYVLAYICLIAKQLPNLFGVKSICYFVVVNFAFLKAIVSFFRGGRVVIWTPRKG